ncbi:MAG: hypothetical protein JNK05_20685 [Myxococcales bacterium]|nr:hypothetical protein [Myxococcales bacterium]
MRLSGAKVRERRRALALTREGVVRAARFDGFDEPQLASIEQQKYVECDEELVDALCRALECKPSVILHGEAAPGAQTSGVEREVEARGPLDRAMDAAFDAADHIAQDRFSVEAALRYVPVGFVPPREAVAVARAWLDAAAVLRSHGVVPTFTTLAACVAALDGFAADHAKRLIERAREAGALDGEPKGDR